MSMPTMPTVSKDTELEEGVLTAPSHEEKEVSVKTEVSRDLLYISPDEDINNNIDVPIPKEGIKVTATMKGFYGQMRKKVGDEFNVKCFEDLGTWTKCKDKELEKKRKEFFKNKKAKK